jgi:hypothetical protein
MYFISNLHVNWNTPTYKLGANVLKIYNLEDIQEPKRDGILI